MNSAQSVGEFVREEQYVEYELDSLLEDVVKCGLITSLCIVNNLQENL